MTDNTPTGAAAQRDVIVRIFRNKVRLEHSHDSIGRMYLRLANMEEVADAILAAGFGNVAEMRKTIGSLEDVSVQWMEASKAAVAMLEAMRKERDALTAALAHAMACDFPGEIDFRCKGCQEARRLLSNK